MRSSSETCGHDVLVRLAVIGLLSVTVAGCSADATRFAADGGTPFGGQPAPEVTGSLPPGAPTGAVTATQLPPPGQGSGPYSQAPAPYGAPVSYASSGAAQPLYGSPAYNAAPSYGGARAPSSGPTYVVEAGDTLDSVARHYGVPAAQLGAANNIAPGMTVRTGQTLVIPPRSSMAQAAPATPAPVRTTTAALPPAKPTQVATEAARPAEKPAAPQSRQVATAAPTAAVEKSAAPASSAKVETAAKVTPAADDDAPRAAGSVPQFRAPVRGRVIATFGPKPGGTHNDGVNFAVPEGTAVRAAEDGTVAYSGNELKGYGNLVLVKHADGYVTAYAHNSELMVKRGDQVRRGQIIAKAGQSGNVSTPQLHFEIRKGTQAVDPSRYVAGL